ncbi:MAG: hypothetical protein D6732_17875, partial [Methanobacteriota archaeon]
MVVEGYGDRGFGVEGVVRQLVDCLSEAKFSTKIVTMVLQGKVSRLEQVYCVPFWAWTGQVRFHIYQQRSIDHLLSDDATSVVHCHGAMSWLQRSATRAAKKYGIPVILSPHGMLESWLWRQKGRWYYLLRRAYWNVFLKPVFRHVDYWHAITKQEEESIRSEFPDASVFRIPNAIDL